MAWLKRPAQTAGGAAIDHQLVGFVLRSKRDLVPENTALRHR